MDRPHILLFSRKFDLPQFFYPSVEGTPFLWLSVSKGLVYACRCCELASSTVSQCPLILRLSASPSPSHTYAHAHFFSCGGNEWWKRKKSGVFPRQPPQLDASTAWVRTPATPLRVRPCMPPLLCFLSQMLLLVAVAFSLPSVSCLPATSWTRGIESWGRGRVDGAIRGQPAGQAASGICLENLGEIKLKTRRMRLCFTTPRLLLFGRLLRFGQFVHVPKAKLVFRLLVPCTGIFAFHL